MPGSGIPKTLVALFVLLQFSITQGRLEAYHRTGCDHVKSIKERLCVLVQTTFSLALEKYYTASQDNSPNKKLLYIRLRKLAFREETGSRQAIAILKIASFNEEGKIQTVSFFVCLENCCVDVNNTFSFELNTTHVPNPISGLTLCEKSVTEFENGVLWNYPVGERVPNRDPKTNARHYIKKVAAIGGIVVGVGAGVAASIYAAPAVGFGMALIAAAAYIVTPLMILHQRMNRSLLKKGYILFELTLVEIDQKGTNGTENGLTHTNEDEKTNENKEGEMLTTTDGEVRTTNTAEGDVAPAGEGNVQAVSPPPRTWKVERITKNETELAETPKYAAVGKLYTIEKPDASSSH